MPQQRWEILCDATKFWCSQNLYIHIYIYIHTPLRGTSPLMKTCWLLLIHSPTSFSGSSFVAQLVKNLPAMWEIWVQSLGWKDPPEKERLPTPIFWPGIHSSTLLYKCLCNIYYYLYILIFTLLIIIHYYINTLQTCIKDRLQL